MKFFLVRSELTFTTLRLTWWAPGGFMTTRTTLRETLIWGLFGGLIVRNPAAPCADHEVPVFIHQFAGSSGVAFQSKPLAHGDSFNFVFADAKIVHYYCAIHGPAMNGTVQVTAGAPVSANVSVQDNKFVPSLIQVCPGGSIHWQNDDNHEHIVFSAGGGAPNFCLNGRPFVGNTPTVAGDTGEKLRWYIQPGCLRYLAQLSPPFGSLGAAASSWRRIRCTRNEFSGNIYHRYRDSSRHTASVRSRAVSVESVGKCLSRANSRRFPFPLPR